MFRRKHIYIVLILLLTITTYFLISSKDSKTNIELFTSIKEKQNTSRKELSNDKSFQIKKQADFQAINCTDIGKVNKIDWRNRADFISAKAILWYFEGHNKYKIAETLAANFNYFIAIKWIEKVNSLSRNHPKHAQLIDTIDAFNYNSGLLKSTKYMESTSDYQLYTSIEDEFDIDQLLNQYPDLASNHINAELYKALENKDFSDALNAINLLKAEVHDPIFFQHPLRNLTNLFALSSFPRNEAEKIIKALFDLSPVFTDKSSAHLNTLKQTLKGMGINEYLWKFQYIPPKAFKADSTIKHLLEKTQKKHNLLNKPSEAICKEKKVNIKLIKKDLDAKVSEKTLSAAWQGVHASYCPDKPFINRIMSVKRKFRENGLFLENLNNFENLQQHSSKLKQVIKKLNESERSLFFTITYMNQQLELEQINTLIKNNITPTNSDFYKLIHRLPLEQQKKLLIKHQYNISQFNIFNGRSIIFSATELSTDDDEIVPFLIQQGFPLKEEESSPDPLWLKLSMMRFSTINEIPVKTISSLIEHTKLNETHVDAMYKIKNNNIALYESLINEFPELEFDAPEELIEISCN